MTVGWLLTVALTSCGSDVSTPRYVSQPLSALAPVRWAPPPARVETVPLKPARSAVWIDGEWAWQGRRWAWRRGRWILPPAGASYSPWTMTRDLNGGVWFAPGAWRNARGEDVTEPDALAVAVPSQSEVTDPSGEKVETDRSVRTKRKKRDGGAPPQDPSALPSPDDPEESDAGAPP